MLSLLNFHESLNTAGFAVAQKSGPFSEPMLTATRETARGTEHVYVTLISPWLHMKPVMSHWGVRIPAEFDERLFSWCWQCDGFGTDSGIGSGSLSEFLTRV